MGVPSPCLGGLSFSAACQHCTWRSWDFGSSECEWTEFQRLGCSAHPALLKSLLPPMRLSPNPFQPWEWDSKASTLLPGTNRSTAGPRTRGGIEFPPVFLQLEWLRKGNNLFWTPIICKEQSALGRLSTSLPMGIITKVRIRARWKYYLLKITQPGWGRVRVWTQIHCSFSLFPFHLWVPFSSLAK